jgi:glycosyltransferase involved in cell wall biosynthesis
MSRIVMVATRVTPGFSGGIDGCIRQWNRLLQHLGHEPMLLSRFEDPSDIARADFACVHVPFRLRLPRRIAYLGDFVYANKLARHVRDEVRSGGDLVVVHEANIASAIFARSGDAARVHAIHQTMLAGPPRASGYKRAVLTRYNLEAARRAHSSWAVSDYVRGVYAGCGIEGSRLSVVYNPVEPIGRGSEAREDGPFRVLWVGGLIEGKMPEVAIDAARKVLERQRDARFDLIGRGWLREELERRAGPWLGKGIHFLGHFTEAAALESAYRKADAFLFTTQHETFGRVLAEAMGAGLPCVASDLPVLREVMGESGLYAPVGDAEAFADCVDRLLQDAELRNRLGRQGETRVRERFSSDVVAAQLKDVVAAALNHQIR